MENMFDGIVRYARREIESRLRNEAEKITAQVIMETMNRISVEMRDPVDKLRTELIFKFEK